MLYYTVTPGATQTTNGSANTANDCFFCTPGSGRTMFVTFYAFVGRGAGLTSISGLSGRIEKWTTTASTGGTAITPAPVNPGYAASKATAGFASATVNSGTGGPTLLGSFGFGTTSPGGWGNPTPQASNLDMAFDAESAATQSIDVFNITGATSLVFEMSAGIAE